jgi:signal transduction histidine kinase
MALNSLRSRLLLGSLFWTLGALAVTHVVTIGIRVRYPNFTLVAHSTLMTMFAIACLLVGAFQFRRGVSPFQQLRARLGAVRAGRERHLGGVYPTEVQPLVDDLNALLEHREVTVSRALAKAGDLAHGLKTPLAVLAQEAARLEAAGHSDLAAAIQQQVLRMQRQVDYHLAHARAAASGARIGARCAVAESAAGLIRTLERLHADRKLIFSAEIAPAHFVRVEREDLDEILGNLLDNGCKWARSRVAIASRVTDRHVEIAVDDDGPGLAPALREVVLQRGVRGDEAAPGSGFGLAIVRDLVELYGGTIVLGPSPLGGLRATITLASAA